MAYVITQNCCKDASCVPVCPVDCIRPVSGSAAFTGAEMLYIDPETCIDCGACMEECPVDAIHFDDDLPAALERFKHINAAYFDRHPLEPSPPLPRTKRASVEPGSLRVAIVGAGPAACYAATELVAIDGVEVNMFERLPTPFGLIRSGVAPDHQLTKSVVGIFARAFTNARFTCHFNVEIGKQLTHQDLLTHHHAVIYAVGASESRRLGIPGEDLPGNHPAADFVGWYNGHPDHANHTFDLSARRAVIIGNGNVALDVARVMLMGPDELARTDAAQHALDALSDSRIEEVVILGRRGPRDAAFSVGEFLALGYLDGVDVVIDGGELESDPDDDIETELKLNLAREFAQHPSTPGNKRIVFRFLASPVAVEGSDRVEGLRISRNGVNELIETSLILRSIGYQGSAPAGLHGDPATGIVPNDRGRVVDTIGNPVSDSYVTGWIKRGPRGVIGTNRVCAEETVRTLLDDYHGGLLCREVTGREAFVSLLTERGAEPVDWKGWRAIDDAERQRGVEASRPRIKFVDTAEMLALTQR
ncbi:FAD-dependent oxidoreductase [Mycobacterium sp. SMC-8]|uniref:FAD-dependent oxidoreductase n=1 Tax=Mycobacterium sp. SMC-8 TaxID=2857060 RepID=UPI0021B37527|nr:FAD-dependent oxidoreductase [Mycobacterium sp. SMC-8]UXA11510.1 FAD-dependent oxidoreductase [Mycobacterium sp. SMC-8]